MIYERVQAIPPVPPVPPLPPIYDIQINIPQYIVPAGVLVLYNSSTTLRITLRITLYPSTLLYYSLRILAYLLVRS